MSPKALEYIARELWTSTRDFVPIRLVDDGIFQRDMRELYPAGGAVYKARDHQIQ